MSDENNIDPELQAEYAEGDRLLQMLEEDEALAQDIGNVQSFAELTEKIRANGFKLSDEVIAEIILEEAEEEGELPDEALEAISGGAGKSDKNFIDQAAKFVDNITKFGKFAEWV